MKLGLVFTSIVSLLLLSSFVVGIIMSIIYFLGGFSWQLLIGMILVYNLVFWLIGPWFLDLLYKWMYKVKFQSKDEIIKTPHGKFMKQICDKYKISVPKFGIIPDRNPTAFTYGSAAYNARVVVSEGLFEFLDEHEIEAVLAHELGHIVHRDFIVMTIASTLLQILYAIYVVFLRSRTHRSSSLNVKKAEKKGSGMIIGLISYVLYLIGTYILLFLSRIREYYADEFAAQETGDSNNLSSALIKIAYGIAVVPDTDKTAHLLNNTRSLGIVDFKSAKEIGLISENSKNDFNLLQKALAFDFVNPWAGLQELKSTHPLIGKRIKRLGLLSKKPMFDFKQVLSQKIDKVKLWTNFAKDLFIEFIPRVVLILLILSLVAIPFLFKKINIMNYIFIYPLLFVIYIVLQVVKTNYKYPVKKFEDKRVIDCMGDLYASPIRGTPILLTGNSIGRGQAGYIFGEDMMFKDNSGIIYLNYESFFGFFGNLIFSWKKFETLINQPAKATGWFLRGATHHVALHRFEIKGTKIKSSIRFWSLFGPIILVSILSLLIFGLFFNVFQF